jgi:putative transposase
VVCWSRFPNGRDELLNGSQFDSLPEARVGIETWRIDYNMRRPHTTHGELAPTSSPPTGPSTNQEPHSTWTINRVPITLTVTA